MELISTNPDWFDQAINKEYKSKFVEVNGAKIEYMEWGDPKTKAYTLHGTNAHAHCLSLSEHYYRINIISLL